MHSIRFFTYSYRIHIVFISYSYSYSYRISISQHPQGASQCRARLGGLTPLPCTARLPCWASICTAGLPCVSNTRHTVQSCSAGLSPPEILALHCGGGWPGLISFKLLVQTKCWILETLLVLLCSKLSQCFISQLSKINRLCCYNASRRIC